MTGPSLIQRSSATVITERVFKWWDYPLFAVLSIVMVVTVTYFFIYWFSLWANQSAIPFVLMTGGWVLYQFLYQFRWFCLPLMRRPLPMTPQFGWKVGVATTFVPGAESIEMLEETVQALVAMDYPHETWVLDEGDDDEVKALCMRLGAYHFSRRRLPQYHAVSGIFESRSKHGNYNAWLYEIGFERYEIIASFDPDHVPNQDFLMQVLGYFDDPCIGYVQSAQVYYNQSASFIARGAAEETYGYYSSIQMVNYTLGYPIVTGCHTTHRVTALKQVGGFAPHAADDLLITLNYRICGWKGVYLPKLLARGLTPVDWHGFLVQQRRWARSVLDIKFRIYPKVARKLPWHERVANFLHGLYYLQSVSVLVQLMALVFVLFTGAMPNVFSFFVILKLALVGIVLQSCELYRQRFFLDPRREVGIHWRSQLLAYAKWPIFLLAIYDVLTHHQGPYTITRKVRTESRNATLLVSHLLIVGVVGTAWVSGTILRHITNPLLHVSAGIIVLTSLVVILTTRMKFPSPYEKHISLKSIQHVEAIKITK